MDGKPDWFNRAACRGLSPELFFTDKEKNMHADTTHARQVCRQCPVIMECLLYAIEQKEDFGVWGGTTPRHRRPRNIPSTIKMVEQIIEDRELEVLTPRAKRRRIQQQRSRSNAS